MDWFLYDRDLRNERANNTYAKFNEKSRFRTSPIRTTHTCVSGDKKYFRKIFQKILRAY